MFYSIPFSTAQYSSGLLCCGQNKTIWFYSAAFCCVLLCLLRLILFCFVPYGSVLLHSVVFCSILFHYILFCCILLSSVLLCTVLFCSIPFCSVAFCCVMFCSELFCYVPFRSVLLHPVLMHSDVFSSALISSFLLMETKVLSSNDQCNKYILYTRARHGLCLKQKTAALIPCCFNCLEPVSFISTTSGTKARKWTSTGKRGRWNGPLEH